MGAGGDGAIDLGIDLGGTAVRAAFGPGGTPVGACEIRGWRWPWLLCEAPGPAGLPAEFPSLKSRLGIAATVRVGDEDLVPERVLAAGLREIRETALTAGDRLGHTAIAVPARFSSRQRGALLRAAEAAGLEPVSLVSDSIAHVIAHAGAASTGTYAVFDMGYTGFELGLVRAVNGRYRAIAYDGAAAPGGGYFDARFAAALLRTLGGMGIRQGDVLHSEAMRRELRDAAAAVKERSSDGDEAFGIYLGPLHLSVGFPRKDFEDEVRRFTAGAFERLPLLLDEAGLRASDVTSLLLAGGSTRMPVVRGLAAAAGVHVTAAEPNALEVGALRYAAQLASHAPVVADAPPGPEGDAAPLPEKQAPPLPGLIQTTTDRSATGPDGARQLLRQGRVSEAERVAREAVRTAEAALREVLDEAADRPPALSGDAERLRARARRLFKQGEYQDAIHVMHVAAEHGGPEVFAEMIQMHCDAAMTDPTIANFKRQSGWLRCAIGHDAGNARLFDLLATRCFLHAGALNRAGRRAEAREAVKEALRWNPDHDEAMALGRQLKPR